MGSYCASARGRITSQRKGKSQTRNLVSVSCCNSTPNLGAACTLAICACTTVAGYLLPLNLFPIPASSHSLTILLFISQQQSSFILIYCTLFISFPVHDIFLLGLPFLLLSHPGFNIFHQMSLSFIFCYIR